MHIATSRFLTRFVLLVQKILLARILGAANIGHIAVVNSVTGLIQIPAGAGTFTVVNKLIAENTGNDTLQKEVIGTSLLLNMLTTIVVGISAWIILRYTNLIIDSTANSFLRFLIFFLPLMIFSEIFKNAIMGQRRMRLIAGIGIGQAIFSIIIVVPMAYYWSINGWFINKLIVICLAFGLFLFCLKDMVSLKWNKTIAGKIGTIGTFAFLSHLLGAMILHFDTLSVSGILKDAALTGVYNTAAMVSHQLMFLSGAVLTVAFPNIAINKNNLPKLKTRYRELYKKIGILSILISLFAFIFSPWIFFVFGEDFIGAVMPFRILLIGFIARSLYVIDNTYFDALGRTDIHFYSSVLTTGLVVLLNFLFIPVWGIIGAAWATTSAMVFGLITRYAALQYFIFKKKIIR